MSVILLRCFCDEVPLYKTKGSKISLIILILEPNLIPAGDTNTEQAILSGINVANLRIIPAP
ncbi:hypothetical protein D3C81_1381170 [compost metagenome]